MKSLLNLKGTFSCGNLGEPMFTKTNQITDEAIKIIATGLVTVSVNYITNLMFLTEFQTQKSLKVITWDDVKTYLAPNSTLALDLNLNVVLDGNEIVYQSIINREFNPPKFNAAALIINGNASSNQDNEYAPSGTEKVFSIVRFPEIKKSHMVGFHSRVENKHKCKLNGLFKFNCGSGINTTAFSYLLMYEQIIF